MKILGGESKNEEHKKNYKDKIISIRNEEEHHEEDDYEEESLESSQIVLLNLLQTPS